MRARAGPNQAHVRPTAALTHLPAAAGSSATRGGCLLSSGAPSLRVLSLLVPSVVARTGVREGSGVFAAIGLRSVVAALDDSFWAFERGACVLRRTCTFVCPSFLRVRASVDSALPLVPAPVGLTLVVSGW